MNLVERIKLKRLNKSQIDDIIYNGKIYDINFDYERLRSIYEPTYVLQDTGIKVTLVLYNCYHKEITTYINNQDSINIKTNDGIINLLNPKVINDSIYMNCGLENEYMEELKLVVSEIRTENDLKYNL